MTFKKKLSSAVALCIAVGMIPALCGCNDLGAYADISEYYSSFGDIVLLSGEGAEKTKSSYSVEEYFYNEDSMEDFLTGDDGSYGGVPSADHVYMAIPVERDMVMDSMALYLRADKDASVYVSVFIADGIPDKWKGNGDPDKEVAEENGETVEKEIEYDDPIPENSIGDVTLRLSAGEWDSFMLESFSTEGTVKNTLSVKKGQYILIQFRNNSGVRVFDVTTQTYVDPKTGLALERAEFTMTNLMIRALELGSEGEGQEEEG